jgi:hypothetical protein
MHIPLRGCGTDSPGLDDVATARQVYGALSWFFAAAAVAAILFHTLFR